MTFNKKKLSNYLLMISALIILLIILDTLKFLFTGNLADHMDDFNKKILAELGSVRSVEVIEKKYVLSMDAYWVGIDIVKTNLDTLTILLHYKGSGSKLFHSWKLEPYSRYDIRPYKKDLTGFRH